MYPIFSSEKGNWWSFSRNTQGDFEQSSEQTALISRRGGARYWTSRLTRQSTDADDAAGRASALSAGGSGHGALYENLLLVSVLGICSAQIQENVRRTLTFCAARSVSMSVSGTKRPRHSTPPAQLFSTESSRLVSSGRPAIKKFGFTPTASSPCASGRTGGCQPPWTGLGSPRPSGRSTLFPIFMVGPHPERPTSRVRSRCLQKHALRRDRAGGRLSSSSLAVERPSETARRLVVGSGFSPP